MQKIKSLYLAHPWDMHEFVRNWELYFERIYKIDLFNPFFNSEGNDIKYAKKGDRELRHIITKKAGNTIVNRDLRAIEKTDGLIAFLEYSKHSLGTPMEIFYSGKILQKPTFVISSNCGGHPWILSLATKVFKNTNSFEQYIKNLTFKI